MFRIINDLREDQKKHFFICFCAASILFLVFNQTLPALKSLLYSFGIVNIGMFILKECVWDYLLKKGTFDLSDCYANFLGSSLACGIIYVMYFLSEIFKGFR